MRENEIKEKKKTGAHSRLFSFEMRLNRALDTHIFSRLQCVEFSPPVGLHFFFHIEAFTRVYTSFFFIIICRHALLVFAIFVGGRDIISIVDDFHHYRKRYVHAVPAVFPCAIAALVSPPLK